MTEGIRNVVALFSLFCLVSSAVGQEKILYGDAAFRPSPERYSGWWGESATGRYPGADKFPIEWDTRTGKNILWSTDVSVWGHSSPVIIGDRMVFQSDGGDIIMALSLADGKILWKRDLEMGYVRPNTTHHWEHGWNFTTPCSDGKYIYAWWPKGKLTSFDLDGLMNWEKDVPRHYENSALPCANTVLAGGVLVIRPGNGHNRMEFPPRMPQTTAGYDAATGEKLWENSILRNEGWTYQTPVPTRVGGEWLLVDWHGNVLRAKDGIRLAGPVEPVMAGSHVAAVCGDRFVVSHGIQPSARSGLPERSRRLLSCRIVPGNPWKIERVTEPVIIKDFGPDGTTLFDGKYVYIYGDQPFLAVYEFDTGRIVTPPGLLGLAMPRPEDVKSLGWAYPRALRVGDYLFAGTMSGTHYILSLPPEIRVLAVNSTRCAEGNPKGWKDAALGTPAFHGNRIYFRHSNKVFCIGDEKAEEREKEFAAAASSKDVAAYRTLLAETDLHVRYRAVRELTTTLSDGAAPELFNLFKSDDPHMRRLAMDSACTLKGEASLAVFKSGLKDPDSRIKQSSLGLIGGMMATGSIGDVAACLADTNADVRLAAVRTLGTLGGAESILALVGYSATVATNQEDAVVGAMAGMRGVETTALLAGHAEKAAGKAKVCLLNAMALRSDAGKWKKVAVDGLKSTDGSVRIAAVRTLQACGGIDDLEALLGVIAGGGDSAAAAVETALVSILARTGDRAGYTRILTGKTVNASPQMMASIVRALGPAGGEAAKAVVEKAWSSLNSEIKTAALGAFAAWPSVEVSDRLLSIAATPSLDVKSRDIIATGLLHMDDLQKDADPAVRMKRIKTALKLTQSPVLRSDGLTRLIDIPTTESLSTAEFYVDATPAGMIAADVIIGIAPSFTNSAPDKALSALKALVREVKDPDYTKDAQKTIELIEKMRSYDKIESDVKTDDLGI